ncbi:DUF3817 domain-containing protein [Roseivirga misakiensis]|uniref:DUF3817 domain-containing protein n=1 Tax=Roseivirga misakiensis TaxID=1563681 RepID=A0A1E5T0Z3_9BACT|nr:DUF3817 domain-containing protein [Roseivirga misakiensis]OEK04977.1 hypothetical protein BFP71_16250 [Roseivirga misakiensis]
MPLSPTKSLKILRILALWEGFSYLLLVGICMPLKYIFNIPEPTYPVGLAHGVLFVSYCILVLVVTLQYKWSFKTMFLAGIASLLPFGTFVADKRIFSQQK